jgi:hypothetical protein
MIHLDTGFVYQNIKVFRLKRDLASPIFSLKALRHSTVAQSYSESRDNCDKGLNTVYFTTIVTPTSAILSKDNHLLSRAGLALPQLQQSHDGKYNE